MLTIKMGVAIHADYSFEVVSDNPVRSAGPYLFVNNELTFSGLTQHGKDIVIGNALFGTSNKEEADFSGVMVPVRKTSIAKVIPTNSYISDTTARTTTITSTINFLVGDFGLTGDSTMVIREFGIENYSRVVIADPFQELDGLTIGPGDKIRVTIDFRYTYYTNNKIGTLGEDVYGERVDYTSEIVKIRDQSIHTVRQNPGYATSNPIDIFPIVKDIRGVPSSIIDFPVRDEFQQEKNVLDDEVHRLDAKVTGYYANRTTVYGFVLRDNVRGMATLVRFLKPVSFDPERRYEVGGYIQWSGKIDDMDDGFSTVELDPVTEIVPITILPSGEVTVLEPSPDVAIDIADLKGLKLALDNLGVVVDIPTDVTWAEAQRRIIATGLFEEVELLSNRVGSRRASLYQYYPPDGDIHKASVEKLKTKVTGEIAFYPSLIAGGDYSNTSISNQWRWDCYFPYIGDIPNAVYVPYGFAGFADSYPSIAALPTKIKDFETLTVQEFTGDVVAGSESLTGKQLIDSRVTAGMLPGILTFNEYPVESANSKQLITTMTSDFDTPAYDDWVEGVSEVTVNLRALDLRTDVVSDNRKDVTSFTLTFDTARHKLENSQLWLDGINYGRIDKILPSTLALKGISLVVGGTTERPTYTFTRPYAASVSPFVDMFILGNEYIFSDGREVAYLTLNGSHGFKVYNSTASDVSNSLYPSENPFLMAGIKLFQPTPDYIFKYTNLTLAQARIYFGDPSIAEALDSSMFELGFEESVYSVNYNEIVNWKSPLLNGPKLYPAIGIDLSRIGDNIPDSDVLMEDQTGKQWTKAELLGARTTLANRVIDDVLYFVTPFSLVEGNQVFTDKLTSAYYDQFIDLNASIIVSLDYPLETAEIIPNPIELIIGRTQQATYTYAPEQAVITSEVWTTLDESIATVSEFGMVTAVSPGTTTLRLVLNNRVIATAVINVTDSELDITCDGAENITTCLNITGTQIGINVNDTPVINNGTGDDAYQHFRDNDNFRIFNCSDYTDPAPTAVTETNFFELGGRFDLWIGGSLIAKNVTEAEAFALIEADGRFVIFDGENGENNV